MPRPRMLMCYLCGREYGSASLGIHIPQCQKKWLAEEALKPRKERRPLPQPPQEMPGGVALGSGQREEMDRFNEEAFNTYNQQALQPCANCGRTFNAEAFAKHQRVCTPERPFKPLPGAAAGGSAARPPSSSGGLAPPTVARGSATLLPSSSNPLKPTPCHSRLSKPTGAAAASPDGRLVSGRRRNSRDLTASSYSKLSTSGARRRSGAEVTAGAAVSSGSGANAVRSRRLTGEVPGGGPPRGPGGRPVAFVCYMCGQQYGSRSLFSHIAQCQKKWAAAEAAKPRARDRRPVPPVPPELESGILPQEAAAIEDFNQRMFDLYNTASLVPCSGCGRTFNPEALERHAKACSGRGSADSGNSGNVGKRPLGFVCYLCGQQFGSASLKIHIPQCQLKWRRKQDNLPTDARRSLPPQPAELEEPLPSTAGAVEEFNARMMACFNGASLQPCSHCGRTFSPEALPRHQRHCTAAAPMKPATAAAAAAASPPPADALSATACLADADPAAALSYTSSVADPSPGDPALEGSAESQDRLPCSTCGRKFLPQALHRHEKVCASVFAKKRKVFNASANRLKGTEASQFYRPAAAAGKHCASPMPERSKKMAAAATASATGGQPAWKTRSEELRQAMRAQREIGKRLAAGEDIRNIPHVPSAPDPSFVQCPHCNRRFNPQAAERHIPHCANTINRPKFLKAGGGGAGRAPITSSRVPGRM